MGGRRGWVGVLLGLCGCGTYPGPACADLRHSPIDVDLSGPQVGFSFDGDQPQGFAVVDLDGAPRWELLCTCEPGERSLCADEEAWEARACIPSPLVYGEVPDVRNLDTSAAQIEPLPLEPGRTYTALLWSDCDAYGPNKIVESTDFVVPVR